MRIRDISKMEDFKNQIIQLVLHFTVTFYLILSLLKNYMVSLQTLLTKFHRRIKSDNLRILSISIQKFCYKLLKINVVKSQYEKSKFIL